MPDDSFTGLSLDRSGGLWTGFFDNGLLRYSPDALIHAENTGRPLISGIALSVHPNPFNHRLVIDCRPDFPGAFRLRILDLTGRCVRAYRGTGRPAEMLRVTWDGRDEGGKTVAPGAYCVRMEGGTLARTVRAILAR